MGVEGEKKDTWANERDKNSKPGTWEPSGSGFAEERPKFINTFQEVKSTISVGELKSEEKIEGDKKKEEDKYNGGDKRKEDDKKTEAMKDEDITPLTSAVSVITIDND